MCMYINHFFIYIFYNRTAARLLNSGDGANTDEYASDQEPLLDN